MHLSEVMEASLTRWASSAVVLDWKTTQALRDGPVQRCCLEELMTHRCLRREPLFSRPTSQVDGAGAYEAFGREGTAAMASGE